MPSGKSNFYNHNNHEEQQKFHPLANQFNPTPLFAESNKDGIKQPVNLWSSSFRLGKKGFVETMNGRLHFPKIYNTVPTTF